MPGFCSLDQNETAFWHSVAVLCCDVRPKIKAPYVVLPWYLIKLGGLCVVVVVQLLSCVWLFAIPQTATHQALLSVSISWSLLTHVHWVSDAIQPSHPLLSFSPSAFNLSQHQGLLQWVSSSVQVAKVLELQLQHQSFSEYSGLISFRMIGSPCSPRDSQEYSPAPQFKSISFSVFNQFPSHSIPMDNVFSPNTPPYHGAQAQSLFVPE